MSVEELLRSSTLALTHSDRLTRAASLMDDLAARVFGPLPDSTWFYPGHGDDSTLGAERPAVPAWRARGW